MPNLNFLKAKEVEWSDSTLYLEGVRVQMVKGYRFGVTTDMSHLFAEGDEPFGIQSGNREPKGSMRLMKSAVDQLNIAAVAAGGRDLMDLELTLVITFKQFGIRQMQKMSLVGLRISGFEYGWDQGAKEMPIDLPFLYEQLTVE